MTFAKKIFAAIFLTTLLVGTALTWAAYSFATDQAESAFNSRYAVLAKILSDTLSRLDTSTEILMRNAALTLVEKDRQHGLLSEAELTKARNQLGVTHAFVIDKNGRFVRSTNEAPAKIPNLFSFSPQYRKLLSGASDVEATPVIVPKPERRPFKFLSVPNFDRTRIIEVGVRVDFIANTLSEAVKADPHVQAMTLIAPDGTQFGTFTPDGVDFKDERTVLPNDLTAPVTENGVRKYFARVTPSHVQCDQCDVAGTSVKGEYFYVLENDVSTTELVAVQHRLAKVAIAVILLNALLSWVLARLLSGRLVRNIEQAAERVQVIKRNPSTGQRIGLTGGDEIAFLTQEFDRLLDSLETSQAQVLEVSKFETKVELANIVAHNIRSPILAIEMMLPTLSELPENIRRVFCSSVKEIKLLTEQLSNRTAVGSSNLMGLVNREQVSIFDILSDVVEQKRVEVSRSGDSKIEFACEQGADKVELNLNAITIKGVLSNLINNAFESYRGGFRKVSVRLSRSGPRCRIEIMDSGRGIDPSLIKALGSQQVSIKKGDGRGIGVSQATKIVSAVGGTIRFDSTVGVGTSVVIEIPVSEARSHRAGQKESPRLAQGL
jgi:signal transduction histidine kinase